MPGVSSAGGAARRRLRWLACVGLVLAGLTPAGTAAQTPDQTPDRIYDIRIETTPPCEGTPAGEIRVLGQTLQLWISNGTNLVPVGSAPLNADGTFSFAVGDANATGHYRATGRMFEVSVSATGTVTSAFLGRTFGEIGDCNFTLIGSLRGGAPAPPPGATDEGPTLPEEVVFDPVSDEPLSDGEVVWLLRQQGVGDDDIQEALTRAELSASSSSDRPPSDEELAERRYFSLLSTLVRADAPDGNDAFPHLSALLQDGGPLANLARDNVASNDSSAARAFHRLARLCINTGQGGL